MENFFYNNLLQGKIWKNILKQKVNAKKNLLDIVIIVK